MEEKKQSEIKERTGKKLYDLLDSIERRAAKSDGRIGMVIRNVIGEIIGRPWTLDCLTLTYPLVGGLSRDLQERLNINHLDATNTNILFNYLLYPLAGGFISPAPGIVGALAGGLYAFIEDRTRLRMAWGPCYTYYTAPVGSLPGKIISLPFEMAFNAYDNISHW